LIVMPLALLENWKREFETWLVNDPSNRTNTNKQQAHRLVLRCRYPDMRVKIIHGQGGKKFKDLETVQKKGGVCLTTYGLVRSNSDKLTMNGKHSWSYVILDEGHLIKNPSCQVSKILRDIPAEHRIILSGTPVQNNLREFWTLFDFISQGVLFGTSREFKEQFENDIVKVRPVPPKKQSRT